MPTRRSKSVVVRDRALYFEGRREGGGWEINPLPPKKKHCWTAKSAGIKNYPRGAMENVHITYGPVKRGSGDNIRDCVPYKTDLPNVLCHLPSRELNSQLQKKTFVQLFLPSFPNPFLFSFLWTFWAQDFRQYQFNLNWNSRFSAENVINELVASHLWP